MTDTTIQLPIEPTEDLLHTIEMYLPYPACEYRREVATTIYRALIETQIQGEDQ